MKNEKVLAIVFPFLISLFLIFNSSFHKKRTVDTDSPDCKAGFFKGFQKQNTFLISVIRP